MKNKQKEQNARKPSISQRIKVKLDYRTTVIINKLSSLKIWKRRYPEAHIIS